MPNILSQQLWSRVFQKKVEPLQVVLEASVNATTAAGHLEAALATQYNLLAEAMESVPWYDNWRVYKLFAISRAAELHEARDRLNRFQSAIQFYLDSVYIVNQNLSGLLAYVQWFDNGTVSIIFLPWSHCTVSLHCHSSFMITLQQTGAYKI